MPACLRFHRRFAWLAAMVVLFATMLPALSQAMTAIRGADDGLTPICTHAGVKWVDAATGEARDAPAGAESAGHLERCPFCLGQPPALPASLSGGILLLPASRDEVPYLFTHAPRTLLLWARAHSRAPPATA
jgi:Protein of unknown function (DUF2946)